MGGSLMNDDLVMLRVHPFKNALVEPDMLDLRTKALTLTHRALLIVRMSEHEDILDKQAAGRRISQADFRRVLAAGQFTRDVASTTNGDNVQGTIMPDKIIINGKTYVSE